MSSPTKRDLAEWDARIEADFRRTVARTKAAGRAKRGHRHVGFPWGFLVDVCRLTEGRAAVVVAQIIYRRVHVCRNETVTLPAAELAEVGIGRRQKNKALARLEAAGLIRIGQGRTGQSNRVTLLWRQKGQETGPQRRHHRALQATLPGPAGPPGSLSTLTLPDFLSSM